MYFTTINSIKCCTFKNKIQFWKYRKNTNTKNANMHTDI